VPDSLREEFSRDLGAIDQAVNRLFALVTESLAGATDAFLSGDTEQARNIKAADEDIDNLQLEIEQLVQRSLMLQSPMSRDLRFLLSVLRIVPELERSGDLAEHIASRTLRGLPAELSPKLRGIIQRMGEVGVEMWREAADAYANRDADVAAELNQRDDELDDLHSHLIAQLIEGQATTEVALEMALIGRFYERLGDHAVHVAERVRYLSLGT
jgi:phosphate transport system protein